MGKIARWLGSLSKTTIVRNNLRHAFPEWSAQIDDTIARGEHGPLSANLHIAPMSAEFRRMTDMKVRNI